MASFAQKFASKKQEGGGNSIQQEIILESMKQASEDLAAQVSQETSSSANIDAILARGSKSLAPDKKSEAETLLEQEIEENSAEKLLKAIELATSPEELSALMQQYEELLASWGEKVSLLRSKKHLEEYLSIAAALSMLQKMLQNPDLLLSGKQLAEMLQNNLKAQQQSISENAQRMQAQNQKLHEQTQLLAKQLSQTEQSLKAAIEALKQDPGKLSPQELQEALKQLQESLKKVQELKENALNGKQLDPKEILESLKKVHEQNQKLVESGKLSETALQAIRQSQQSLQQAMQQVNVVQQLQKTTNALKAAQVQQISQNASQLMQSQISTLAARMNSQTLSPEAKGQLPLQQRQPSLMETLPLPTRVMAEASGYSTALRQVVVQQVQQQATVVANNTMQQAHVAEQVATRAQSVPDNVVQITSATQHQARQEQVSERQFQLSNTPKDTQEYLARQSANAERTKAESSTSSDIGAVKNIVCTCPPESHAAKMMQRKTEGFSFTR